MQQEGEKRSLKTQWGGKLITENRIKAGEGWSALRIVEVGEQEAIDVLQHQWQTLQAQCPCATPFQTWEWNAAWWRHFGARKRPRLLLFWANQQDSGFRIQDSGEGTEGETRRQGDGETGRRKTEDGRRKTIQSTIVNRQLSTINHQPSETLVGLAPFYTSFHLGTPLRRLAWIGTGQSDYLGPLVHPDWEMEVHGALHAYLKAELRGWDIADLQQLRPDSPLLMQADAHPPRRGGDRQSVMPMEPCPYVTLPSDWTTFTARLGKKMRSNLGYYDRLLQRTFPTTHYHVADADTLDAGMTALFDLHQKRWNARWLPGVLGTRRVQAFHRDVAAGFLAAGWLRLHLLTVDDSIRAALYCFTMGERTFYYLGGFAPELSKYSLGTLLTARAIRQSIEEGCDEFDFLRGSEPYKYRWLPQERMNHRLLLLRSHEGLGGLGELPGRAGFALNRVERYVVLHAKAFAEQQGRKEHGGETVVSG